MEAKEPLQFPTRQSARSRREMERSGYLLPLPRTGGVAHVRALSLADSSTFAGLPMGMANEVLAVFNELNGEQSTGALTMERLRRNQERQERLANLVAIAGFIKPRLVSTEAELGDDPYTMLVSDIHLDERIKYLNLTLSGDAESLDYFRTDPEKTVGTMATLPTSQVAAEAVNVNGIAGSGVSSPTMPSV